MAHNTQSQGRTAPVAKHQDGEIDFDQWAKAVRQQMIEALKRRGNQGSL